MCTMMIYVIWVDALKIWVYLFLYNIYKAHISGLVLYYTISISNVLGVQSFTKPLALSLHKWNRPDIIMVNSLAPGRFE